MLLCTVDVGVAKITGTDKPWQGCLKGKTSVVDSEQNILLLNAVEFDEELWADDPGRLYLFKGF